jgi:hypothetical protein
VAANRKNKQTQKQGKKRGKPDAASVPQGSKKKAKAAAAVAASAGAPVVPAQAGALFNPPMAEYGSALLNSINELRKSVEDHKSSTDARLRANGL